MSVISARPISKAQLAEAIYDMRFGDLQDVARDLHGMASEGDVWDLKDDRDWARMLYAWAEANVGGQDSD